jgi:hypothetical protein
MNFTVNGITKFYLNKVRLFRNTSYVDVIDHINDFAGQEF